MGLPNYTCPEITNALYTLTGQVSSRLFYKIAATDPWVAKTPRGEWPTGQGFTISNMMLERTTTDSETGDEWVDAAPSALTGESGGPFNNCQPTPEVLKFGQTLRSMKVSRRDIQTDDFCINDLAADFQVDRVLANIMNILEYVTEWVWMNRAQNEYVRLSDHKVTEKATGFDLNATTFDASTPPTSRLTNGTMEQVYNWLIMEGAAGLGANIGVGGPTNMPIFEVFTDPNTARDLLRQDPELRMDFRYANPQLLISDYGTGYSHNGFKYTWNKYPPRYEISGGAYVRVYPFKAPTSTTKGWKRDVNPAYLGATYQDTIVHIPAVYTQLMERPPTNPGGKVKFDYYSHMGDFQFLVIKDKKCNPRGELGFFDALFASASEPGHTELGFVIRHLNCQPLRTLKPSCYS